jgi:RNA polymerase sigma-70 factor, ECF subfamily
MAGRLMSHERSGHTLQPTALVSEAYLKLAAGRADGYAGRADFYHAAAAAMRRILIDHARKRGAMKRGRAWERQSLDLLALQTDEDFGFLLLIDEALQRLETESPRAAEVVRLRFFAGLSVEQTAEVTGRSRRTVLRDWEYARAWLLVELKRQAE